MSNAEIVKTMRALHGVAEECHTYQHWRAMGRQVKRGEKAVFMAPMWKPNTKKNKDGEEVRKGFFAKESAFFTLSQTEEIKTA